VRCAAADGRRGDDDRRRSRVELTGRFLALGVENGEVLYRFQTGGPIMGGVVSYEVDGKQHVAVASGAPLPRWARNGHVGAATIVVLALP
jgi:alcohol dehydrogenase (cytochrome c)